MYVRRDVRRRIDNGRSGGSFGRRGSWRRVGESPVPESAAHDEVPALDVPRTLKLGQPSNIIFAGCWKMRQHSYSMEEAGAAVDPMMPLPLRHGTRSCENPTAAACSRSRALPLFKSFREAVLGMLNFEIKNEWTKREFKPRAFDDTDDDRRQDQAGRGRVCGARQPI